MTKKWLTIICFLLLSGTAALADGWSDKFKTLDADGNGTISIVEWQANAGKANIGKFEATFSEMDKDNSNSIDSDEWAAAEKIVKAHSTSCKEASSSWCPCQNHPEKPECQ